MIGVMMAEQVADVAIPGILVVLVLREVIPFIAHRRNNSEIKMPEQIRILDRNMLSIKEQLADVRDRIEHALTELMVSIDKQSDVLRTLNDTLKDMHRDTKGLQTMMSEKE
jgi:hypothetical protein